MFLKFFYCKRDVYKYIFFCIVDYNLDKNGGKMIIERRRRQSWARELAMIDGFAFNKVTCKYVRISSVCFENWITWGLRKQFLCLEGY